jgi:hypothetical protein
MKTNKMKQIIINIIKKDYFYLFLLLIIMLFYSANFVFNYLDISNLSTVGGWDGTNHFAISKFYAQNIFPNVFSWTFNWNAGMVFPLGYPPFSYMLLGILNWLLPFKFIIIFKYFFVLVIFSLPVIFYYLSKTLNFNKTESFLSAALFTFFLVSPFYFASGGFSFLASFKSGLYSQLLAGMFFLLWIYFFLNIFKNKKYFIYSTIFLFLVLLSNIHVGETALVFLFSFFVGDVFIFKKKNKWKIYLLHFILSFLLLSFWSFPLISTLNYFPSITFQSIYLAFFFEFPVLIMSLFSLFGLAMAVIRKNRIFINIGISSLLFAVLIFFPISSIFKSLPLQPGRIIPALFISLNLLSIYGLRNLILKFKIFDRYNAVIFVIIFFLPWLVYTDRIIKNFNFPYILPSTSSSLETLSNLKEGRSTIEVVTNNAPINNYLAAQSPLNSSHQTIWNVFRESTLNSIFTAPLRNFFSKREESYGVVCGLCDPKRSQNIKEKGLDINFEKARLYGVKYFLLRSEDMYKDFLKNPQVELVEISYDYLGKWSLFQLKEDLKYANSLKYEPALVYTDLKSKHREFVGPDAYDWLGMAEYWFESNDFDIILARDGNSIIDQKDLNRFTNLVLIDYKYKNLNDTVEALEKYIENNNLILFVDKNNLDDLAIHFLSIKNDNLKIIIKSGNVKKDFITLMDFLNNKKQKANHLEIKSASLSGNSINISAQSGKGGDIRKENEYNKVYIKSSFFPLWESKDKDNNTNVYLATGAMMLALSEEDSFSLEFNKYPKSFKLGLLISILTFIYLFYFIMNNVYFRDS